ncbi:MAG: MFS transporter, partial [Desulfovibrio sp.]|nr:MFS transporter [Desulfovibrio sp.]
LGGMAGSLFGSLFAWLGLSPFLNFLIVCGGYLCLLPTAYKKLEKLDVGSRKDGKAKSKSRVPLFIYLCGVASMLCYVSEGSVGEWGSILLHSTKGAPQDQAALVFACFCCSMVIFRFLGDRIRQTFDESLIVCVGGLIGTAAMSVVLLSSSPIVCLAAYAVMGIGFAPIVPILFSRAGKCPGVDQAKASSTMSVMSYTGLLVFPPFLGFLGDHIGLDSALWLIAFFCLCIAVAGPLLLGKVKRG